MRYLLTLVLVCSLFVALAQKRNIIKPLCFDWEYMDYMVDGVNENISNVYNFRLGYERLIGMHVSAAVNYVQFISGDQMNVSANYYGGDYQPEKIQGYRFSEASYQNKIKGFEYESRYFFNPLEKEGLNSGYIGFMYSYLTAKQSLTNVQYEELNYNGSLKMDYPDKEVNIHRFGVKIGYAGSGALYSDIHVGVYYNNQPSDYNQGWTSPSDIYPVSVMLGWHFGIPF